MLGGISKNTGLLSSNNACYGLKYVEKCQGYGAIENFLGDFIRSRPLDGAFVKSEEFGLKKWRCFLHSRGQSNFNIYHWFDPHEVSSDGDSISGKD